MAEDEDEVIVIQSMVQEAHSACAALLHLTTTTPGGPARRRLTSSLRSDLLNAFLHGQKHSIVLDCSVYALVEVEARRQAYTMVNNMITHRCAWKAGCDTLKDLVGILVRAWSSSQPPLQQSRTREQIKSIILTIIEGTVFHLNHLGSMYEMTPSFLDGIIGPVLKLVCKMRASLPPAPPPSHKKEEEKENVEEAHNMIDDDDDDDADAADVEVAAAGRSTTEEEDDLESRLDQRILYLANLHFYGTRNVNHVASSFFETSSMLLKACIPDPCSYLFTNEDHNVDIFLCVSRSDLLYSSFREVMAVSREQWDECASIYVKFAGETAYGEGVARDWLTSVCQELFYGSSSFSSTTTSSSSSSSSSRRPRRRLFKPCPGDPAVLHPFSADEESSSLVSDEDEDEDDCGDEWFDFAGRLMGFAIKFSIPTGVFLSSSCIKMMSNRHVSLEDLRQVDPDIARSFESICRVAEEEEVEVAAGTSAALSSLLDAMQLTNGFCALSAHSPPPLFPGGEDVAVTRHTAAVYSNMAMFEYMWRSSQRCLRIKQGIEYVLYNRHFAGRVAVALMKIRASSFNELVGGSMEPIDVDDWRRYTFAEDDWGVRYDGGDAVAAAEAVAAVSSAVAVSAVSSAVAVAAVAAKAVAVVATAVAVRKAVDMFFDMLSSFKDAERRRVLRFWTGLWSLPKGGFRGLERLLRIVVRANDSYSLPEAQTCVMSLRIAVSDSMQDMRDKFSIALAHMDMED